ncbi:MAG: hypothetical protein WCF68_00035 [Terriglobales bacterium]
MQKQNKLFVVAIAAVLVLSFATFATAQERGGGAAVAGAQSEATPRGMQSGHIYTPESSIERPEDAGLRFHTNYVFPSVDGKKPAGTKAPQRMETINPDSITEIPETPNSMGCLYVKSPTSAGCVPNYNPGSGGPSSAGWGAIALVDAFDNPDASSDLAAFDSYWGLPAASFLKVYANGNGDCTAPPANAGWSVEESLDIEWAHVFAPKAIIILVEACSNSGTDLYYAEQVAFSYVQYYGGGAVSNSWGSGEYSGENSNDALFAGFHYNYTIPTVTFASAGDSGCGAAYPSSNPWLTSAGGTSVLRTASNDHFSSESCWAGSGGGTSSYETWANSYTGSNTGAWADYQYPILGEANRATPDFAFNADPSSGVYIYNAYDCGGFCYVGGTSVASPSLASIVNRAGNKLSTWYGFPTLGYGYFSNEENTLLYSQLPTALAYKTNFYDIKTGGNSCTVKANWDYCTGVGSPRGLLGK